MMQDQKRQQRQLSLEESMPTKPKWSELPQQVRSEVIELLRQLLVEHVEAEKEACDE